MMPISYPDVLPMPGIPAWTQTLTQIAAAPLTYCPDFPQIAARHEAFWSCALIDRPIFIAEANRSPARPVTRRLDLLDDPDAWLAAKLADLDQLHRVGDALPNIRIDFGPVSLGGMFGARVDFETDTTWTHPMIDDDWSGAPAWTIAVANSFWVRLHRLAARLAEDAPGRYLVRTPDLGGSGDVLLNLRGSAKLAMDVIDQPDQIEAAVEAIYPQWHRAFTALFDLIVGRGMGIIHFPGLWSNQPHMVPACDFNALIGPRAFGRLLLPDIARQAATVGRAIFHLDGPDAARHVDALLDLPEIQAIQYVPGAGTPSALAKIDMLKKIQARGRALQIICPFDEVLAVCDALKPEGLAFLVETVPSPEALDGLYAQFCARYGC